MKKILLVTGYIGGFGGIETVILNFVENVHHFGYKIKLLSLLGKGVSNGDESWCQHLDYQVINFEKKIKSKKIKKLYKMFTIIKVLLKERPEIIISIDHHNIPFIKNAIKVTGMKIRLFYWPHANLEAYLNVTEKYKKYYINNIRYADEFLAISNGVKSQLISLGVNSDKIYVVYNPLPRKQEVIPKSKDSNHFVYMGRLEFTGERKKQIKDLIDAFSTIEEPYTLKLIGDGEDKAIIIDYIESKRLENKITLTNGWLADPWSSIDTLDSLILVTNSEGLPMVLGEALARGVPCISTSCSGAVEIVQDGVNGYLYELHNINEFKEKILNIMYGKLSYTPEQLKASIEKLYEDNYYKNIGKILKLT